MKEIYEYMDFISKLVHGKFDYDIYIINIILLVGIICLHQELNLSEFIKQKNLVIMFVIDSILIALLHVLIGDMYLIYPIIIYFGVNFLLILKDKSTYEYFSKDEKGHRIFKFLRQSNNDELMKLRVHRLGKEKDFNILDVLYIYDYISDYQRRKVIQSMIYENFDSMANTLLTTSTISENDLKEAKAILNLIELEGELVSKEDAIMYLIENERNIIKDDNATTNTTSNADEKTNK